MREVLLTSIALLLGGNSDVQTSFAEEMKPPLKNNAFMTALGQLIGVGNSYDTKERNLKLPYLAADVSCGLVHLPRIRR